MGHEERFDALSAPRGYVVDQSEYDRIHAEALSLVVSEKQYPDYVFSNRFKHHYFMETVVAQDAAFLATLCAATDETEVLLVSIEPEAQQYWHLNGHRGAIRMDVNDVLQSWQKAMSFSRRNGENTLNNSPNRQVIFGRSKNWIAHVDIAWDLAVLGINVSIRKKMIAGIQFIHNAAWAKGYWRAQGSWMDDAFYEKLGSNYPNPKSIYERQFPITILSRN